MKLWRLTRAAFVDQALSGQWARKHGGRWNSKGVAVVYASESLELALLEALVHLDPDLVPKDLYQLCFEVDDALIAEVRSPLPKGWNQPPPYRSGVQAIGDRWVQENSSVGLKIPASVLPNRYNLLLNPAHSDFIKLRAVSREPLPWPTRIVDYIKDVRAKTRTKTGSRRKLRK